MENVSNNMKEDDFYFRMMDNYEKNGQFDTLACRQIIEILNKMKKPISSSEENQFGHIAVNTLILYLSLVSKNDNENFRVFSSLSQEEQEDIRETLFGLQFFDKIE
ncbi:MAG: hypothetical protein ACTSVU_07550 [Promethearchaeota archaeon]